MSTNKLKEKLIELWQAKKLAHFYILQASTNEQAPRDFLREWSKNFITTVISKEKGLDFDSAQSLVENGHADILFINKESSAQNYNVKDDSFDEFFRFQNFKNFELSQKFIVIDDAHSITTILSNKLLKTLEEPADNTTIFLLDPLRHEILPTIASRALLLRIPSSKPYTPSVSKKKFSSYLESIEFNEELVACVKKFEANSRDVTHILEYLKNDKEIESHFIEAITNFVSSSDLDYEKLEKFLDSLKWYQKAKTFNNYSPEKITGLMHSIN